MIFLLTTRHSGAMFPPAEDPTTRKIYTSVAGGATKANLPKVVQEFVKRTGKPASQYTMSKRDPKYPDFKKGLVTKLGVPTRKAMVQKGERSGARKGRAAGDYSARNQAFRFRPGMFTSDAAKKWFPQLGEEGKEEEEEEEGEEKEEGGEAEGEKDAEGDQAE